MVSQGAWDIYMELSLHSAVRMYQVDSMCIAKARRNNKRASTAKSCLWMGEKMTESDSRGREEIILQ